MKKILISTFDQDPHALVVSLALQQKGHQPLLWLTDQAPEEQLNSFSISHAQEAICTVQDIEDKQFDTVWLRRPRSPVPASTAHPEDKSVIEAENKAFYDSIWHVLANKAFWVNPYVGAFKAKSKVLQLKLAKQLGFNIPNTLISNEPEKIKPFIEAHRSTGVIYKSLSSPSWKIEEDEALLFCSEISKEQLPSDMALRMCPGIFQEKINKRHEIRATLFGGHEETIRIYSQEHSKAKSDWRAGILHGVKVEPCKLPERLHIQCRRLMKAFGICFACFDFIVTNNDEYVFLELNEAGQFLWVESLCQELKLLDAFTDFLIQKDPCFKYVPGKHQVQFKDFSIAVRPDKTGIYARKVN